MAKMRLYPHRTGDQASVTFGDWWIERSGERTRLPDRLSGWDYASEELVGTTLTIDVEALLRSTGHTSFADLELLLVADCAAAQRRVISHHPFSDFQEVRDSAYELALPPGQLAKAIRLTAHLVVARDLNAPAARVADRRGARLLSSKPRTVALEGDASRFPTEATAFSELHLPDAPWTLHTTFQDLDVSFMGAVRLLVNTENPVGRMLLDNTTADRVSGIAMADVIRLLVASMADHEEQIRESGYEEGSVGSVVGSMCTFFLGHRLTAAVQLYQREPVYFDRLLHERLRPLAKAFA